jgi:hypothetical protein
MIRLEALPPQVFIPRPGRDATPSRDALREPSRSDHSAKPGGGLWTSTLDTSATDGWEWWCAMEMPHWLGDRGFVLRPTEARVLTVDGQRAVDWFVDRFCDVEDIDLPAGFGSFAHLFPNWARLAEEVDALRVTAPYSPAVRFGKVLAFYGWDCEATWWARWMFEETIEEVAVGARRLSV